MSVIKVGAHTEVELKEKKMRIEDAVSATRAAIEEGIVAGGGSAIVQASTVLEGDLGLTGDEAVGVRAGTLYADVGTLEGYRLAMELLAPEPAAAAR